jgi:hypothetical protein
MKARKIALCDNKIRKHLQPDPTTTPLVDFLIFCIEITIFFRMDSLTDIAWGIIHNVGESIIRGIVLPHHRDCSCLML